MSRILPTFLVLKWGFVNTEKDEKVLYFLETLLRNLYGHIWNFETHHSFKGNLTDTYR